jgi:DNA-binding MarR family transcriptional regulator
VPLRILTNITTPPDGGKNAAPGMVVVDQLRTILSVVTSQLRQFERKAGLGGSQLWALSLIAGSDPMGVSELANAMGIHQSTASNLLKPMMERELIIATRTEEDRRAVRLQITAKGKRLMAKAPGPMTGVLAESVAELDPATVRRLERDLARLVELMQDDAPKATGKAAKRS